MRTIKYYISTTSGARLVRSHSYSSVRTGGFICFFDYTVKEIAYSWSGLCLWVDLMPENLNGKQITTLHKLGARYSHKRDRYYLRASNTANIPKGYTPGV